MTNSDWYYDDLGWHLRSSRAVDETPIADLLEPEPAPVAVQPRATNALGIDVSNWQGQPNWAQVASSGRQFCYIKATEGTGYTSPVLDSQFQGATAAGLVTGCYCFADPSQSPEANADFFSAQVNRLQATVGHLPPCLDLETGTGDLSNWASRFVTRLRANTGCTRVMIYSSASFFQNQIREDWCDNNVALWIAHFGAPPGKPMYLSPRVAIHQYADNGQVSGIAGNVDLDFAIWDLNTIVPGASPVNSNDLTAEQASALTACYQQLSGSPNVGSWPGWPSWPGGSGRSLTLVDYSRQADVILNALMSKVTALDAKVSTSPPGSLSDTDIQKVATAVVNMLAQRMTS